MPLVEKFILPFPGTSVSEPVHWQDGADQVLELNGTDLCRVDGTVWLRFVKTRAYRVTTDAHVPGWQIGAYDKLCEVLESDWVAELRKNTKSYGRDWVLRHFLIYIDDSGAYEFVAEDAVIESRIAGEAH